MSYLEIEKVIGREILDSRGNPTVEAQPENLKHLNLGTVINPVTLERVYQKL